MAKAISARRAARARCAAALSLALCAAPAVPAVPADRSVQLEDLTWTELRDAIRAGASTAIIPIGGTEQSGPALALGKHNVRVHALCERIARGLGNAIVAPVIAYVPEGSIDPPGGHMRFTGTLSLSEGAFEQTLVDAARSLRVHGFRDIVLLGDHGGYQTALGRVAARLNREWRGTGARAYAPAEYYRASTEDFAQLLRARGIVGEEAGAHAALADTSLQLALDPAGVREDVLRSWAPLDASVGIYGGDPRHASAEIGRLAVEEIVRQSVEAIRRQIGAAHVGASAETAPGQSKDGPR